MGSFDSMLYLKESGWVLIPEVYRPYISLFNIIIRRFESNISKKVVDHINRKNLLRDKQYGFLSSRATADVFNCHYT